ncbi:DPOE2 polymerase, partial [Polypterus senegalus]
MFAEIKKDITKRFMFHTFLHAYICLPIKSTFICSFSEASKYLTEVLSSVNELDFEDVIERLLDAVEKQPLSSNMIELPLVELAVQECSQSSTETIDHVFNIIGAFDVPRYIYSSERKKFIPLCMSSHQGPTLCGSAKDKADLFRERYTILQQLKTVEALLGSTAKLGEIIVLGMITQLKEGKFYLEDPTGCVQLNISKAISFNLVYIEFEAFDLLTADWTTYFLCPSSYFLLFWSLMGLKQIQSVLAAWQKLPLEVAYYGDINFFGGPSSTSVKASARLKQLEDENEDAMFVFVSDVWLDSVEVLEKIHTMFADSLKALADMICEYPDIHKRPPLAEYITEEFRQKVPFSVFTTNPCRIQYCTQEIVVFREDMVNKMCRNCVRFPSSSFDIPNHFIKTILSQGHLTPLPLYVSPAYWAYDYALRVYPVPDVIVFADKYDPFNIVNTDCLCVNPIPMADGNDDDNLMQADEHPEDEDDDDDDEVEEGEEIVDLVELVDIELASPSEDFDRIVPAERSGHVAVADGNCMYVWGGYKFYRLPLRSSGVLRWEKMRDLAGLPPSCKDKLGCWVYRNKLIFFGGYGYVPVGNHRGTFEYDESSFWGNPPSPRAAHACATLGNCGYVFGGRILSQQQCPVGRSWHSLIPVSQDSLFLFGGFTTDKEPLSDAWLYCISRNEWRPFKHNHMENPRLCLEMVIHFKEILASSWDCLPKDLLRNISHRAGSNNVLGS